MRFQQWSLIIHRSLPKCVSLLNFFFFIETFIALVTSRGVLFLRTGIKSFNCSMDEYLQYLQGIIKQNVIFVPERGPLCHFSISDGYFVYYWSAFISPMLAFITSSAYSRRPGTSFLLEKKIVSRSILSTILFQVTLFSTIKASDILVFINIYRNYFYQ